MISIDAIREARDLERRRDELLGEISSHETKSPDRPVEPSMSFAPEEHPKIVLGVAWEEVLVVPLGVAAIAFLFGLIQAGVAGGLLSGVLYGVWALLVWGGIYLGFCNKKRQEKRRSEIEGSTEYAARCAEVDARNEKRRREAQERFDREMKTFEETELPRFEQELAEWKRQHFEQMDSLRRELDQTEKSLIALYAEANIPEDCRSSDVLEQICLVAESRGLEDSPEQVIPIVRQGLQEQAASRRQMQMRAMQLEMDRAERELAERQAQEEARQQRSAQRGEFLRTAMATHAATAPLRKDIEDLKKGRK